MKTHLVAALSIALLASAGIATSATAQEKTRTEVRQELIQAENNGSRFVTDTSYPAVNPIFTQQVARLQAQNSGAGAEMTGSSESGRHAAGDVTGAAKTAHAPSHCVGPVSYCSIYFGS
ncbi:DUF4148 domain-containing protein [Trinickia violacea]|uniref:DUF4148 domain-containing protein n=1 Tax=Trinickia violacea TaxID=2571746 RepID=A0A4P8J242_9BURK|nr:DUF4148 domain-containing protein [Trinickia violacea]QCP54987.1 DUF4148 domain-containing protein [Trinickia violacea]